MKIKIIKVPGFHSTGLIPPFGVTKIYTYLKEKGFDIVQEDLNIISHPAWDTNIKRVNKERFSRIFAQKERLIRYLTTGRDQELEDITNFYVKNMNFADVDILLMSVFTCDFCSSILALLIARYFKSKHKDKPVVIGGEFIPRSYIYENIELYNNLGLIDYYIFGYGERPLEVLLEKMKKLNYKKDGKLSYLSAKISWLMGKLRKFLPIVLFMKISILIKSHFFPSKSQLSIYKSAKLLRRNNKPEGILVVPDFTGLPLERYEWSPGDFLVSLNGKKALPDDRILTLPYQIILGCPNRCAFCASSLSKTINFLRPREAVDNLSILSKKYKTKYFFFLNNHFNISRWFVEEFYEEVKKQGLEIFWSDCANFKNINNPAMLAMMREAGACRLIFGLESASPRMQHYINKKIDLQHASEVLKWSHEAGIWTGIDIIAGMAHEKPDDIYNTLNFLNANAEYIDEVWVTRFWLEHNSLMFNYPRRYAITNIRDSDYVLQELIAKGSEVYRYGFDEVGGLGWQEKRRQIDDSFETIKSWVAATQRLPFFIPGQLNLLFYLYTHLADKNEIKYYYRLYRKWFYSAYKIAGYS